MKRKLSLLLTIVLCFSALLVLTSCDFVLDLIFGSKTPTDNPNNNEPPAHVHKMQVKTYVGETCSAQTQITYYECSDCNKRYLDADGNDEIADISALGGHVFVVRRNDNEHYYECSLCHTEQDNSRQKHSSNRWWYNPSEHYKLCDVCEFKFDVGAHVETETGACSVCKRHGYYKEVCNSRYGYEQLATLTRGDEMQELYNAIDAAVSAAHDDASFNANSIDVDFDLGVLLNIADAKVTVASYVHDNPLYYWLDRESDYKYSNDDNRPVNQRRCMGVVLYVVDEYRNGSDRANQNEAIYAEIDEYLSEVANEKDNYQIALWLHDAIIKNVDYATKTDGTAETAHWAHSIVGVFDKKSTLTNVNSAVCEGYAKAFQLLLNACGVPNVYVTGKSHEVGHAWNTVKLSDNNWYLFDLTWDDQPGRVGGKIYDYFCKTGNDFNSDHEATVSNAQDGVNYLYELPAAATDDYKTDGLEIDESFTKQNLTFTLVGYNSLSLTKCLFVADDGIVTIPANVEQGGRTYAVTQIGQEALATYTLSQDNKTVLSVSSPSITKLVIPSTVKIIYGRSFCDCKTLENVEFADCDNWQRYVLSGEKPAYEQLLAADLANDAKACALLKQKYKPTLFSETANYLWTKN